MSLDRTCPKCRTDEYTKHVVTKDMAMTFRCQTCKLEWTCRIGVEPRPSFSSQGEAA